MQSVLTPPERALSVPPHWSAGGVALSQHLLTTSTGYAHFKVSINGVSVEPSFQCLTSEAK